MGSQDGFPSVVRMGFFPQSISAIKVRANLEAVPFHPILCGDEYNDHHGHMKTTYIRPSVGAHAPSGAMDG